jgi:XRE family transcriptional regulator of biofilm formation
MENHMSVVGDRIKQRRVEVNISLAELARRADLSKGYLHAIESGETQSPSAEILYRIANELGTTIADLLGENPELAEQKEHLDISQSLLDFASQDELPDADVKMLARIQYRGKRPNSVPDWRFIYESIKRTIR